MEDDIPRYPPFMKGLPYAPVSRIVEDQHELMMQLKQASGLTDKEYKKHLYPSIVHYAEYAHLLPASKAHHHRLAGGLFRHGLEAALLAARACDSTLFINDGSPKERKVKEKVWRVATIIAALLHDSGKPVTDVHVTNKEGDKQWNPHTQTMYTWLTENSLDRYYLRWRVNRHNNHKNSGNLPEGLILTDTKQWFFEIDDSLNSRVINAITGSGDDLVSKIVKKADSDSVKKDMENSDISPDSYSGDLGIPLASMMLDDMRSLIESGKWKVNQRGGYVWYTEEGVFISWKHAGPSLVKEMKTLQRQGVPRAIDTLASELIDHSVAVKRQLEDGGFYLYWDVAPSVLTKNKKLITLRMIKLASAKSLFPDVEPEAITAFVGDDIEAEQERLSAEGDVSEGMLSKIGIGKGKKEIPGDDVTSEEENENKEAKITKDESKDNTPLEDESNDSEAPETDTPSSASTSFLDDMDDNDDDDPFSQGEVKKASSQEEDDPFAPSDPEQGDTSEEEQEEQSASSILYETLFNIYQKDPSLFSVKRGRLYIVHPGQIEAVVDPKELLHDLQEEGMLYTDPVTPSRKLHREDGKLYLVINQYSHKLMTGYYPEIEAIGKKAKTPKAPIGKQVANKKPVKGQEPSVSATVAKSKSKPAKQDFIKILIDKVVCNERASIPGVSITRSSTSVILIAEEEKGRVIPLLAEHLQIENLGLSMAINKHSDFRKESNQRVEVTLNKRNGL